MIFEDNMDEFWNRHTKELNDYLLNSCVSLYTSTDDDLPLHRGSGVFLCYNKNYYFVTAQHLIKDHKNKPLYLSYKKSLIQVGGDFVSSKCTKDQNKTVDIDIAFIPIKNFDLFDKNDFINIDKFIKSAPTVISFYGFPNSKNKPNKLMKMIVPQPCSYYGKSFSLKYFLKVTIDEKKVLNENGNKTNIFNFKGMSGGVVTSFSYEKNTISIELEGIIIEQDRKDIIATKIVVLKKMLDDFVKQKIQTEAIITLIK